MAGFKKNKAAENEKRFLQLVIYRKDVGFTYSYFP
jgi:hypothetical protein